MNINELKQLRSEKIEKMESIFKAASNEKRSRNEAEVAEWEAYETEVRNLDAEIEAIETQEKRNKQIALNNKDNNTLNNKMTIRNLIKENRNGVGFNPFTIDTRSIDLTSGLYNETVLGEIYNNGEKPQYLSMGIAVLQGLEGNVKLPKFSAPLIGGKVAPGAAANNDKTISFVDLIDNEEFKLSETVSLDMLKNDTVVTGIINQLIKGVDRKISQAVFSVALAGATAVTGATSITKDNIMTLESKVDADNVAYLASKEAFATGRALTIDSGSGLFLFKKTGNNVGENFEGTKLFYSAGISKQLIFGDLDSLVYGDWGQYEVGYDINNANSQAVITVKKKASVVFRGHSGSLVKTVIA